MKVKGKKHVIPRSREERQASCLASHPAIVPMDLEFRALSTVVLPGWYMCLRNLEQCHTEVELNLISVVGSIGQLVLVPLSECYEVLVWNICKQEPTIAYGMNHWSRLKKCSWRAAV